MKKGLCMIAAVVFLLSLCACGYRQPEVGPSGQTRAAGETEQEESLLDRGADMVARVREIAGKRLKQSNTPEQIIPQVQQIAEGAKEKPDTVYRLTVSAQKFLDMEDYADDPSEAYFLLFQSFNSMGGTTALAAAGCGVVRTTFVSTELTENTAFIYTYHDAVPIAVIYTLGEDHSVLATGLPLVSYDVEEAVQQFKTLLDELDARVEAVQE